MRLPQHIVLDNKSLNLVSLNQWPLNLQSDTKTQLEYPNQILKDKFRSNLFGKTSLKTIQLYLKSFQTNSVQNNNGLYNFYFLRKERLYTKLKYSRTPAYDIVSGGLAAFFAAILGYLTTEKFGFELVDSGDFYYIFMYVVFLVFSIRPLLLVHQPRQSLANLYSIKRIINFLGNVFILLTRTFK